MSKLILFSFFIFTFFSCISHKQLRYLKDGAGKQKTTQDTVFSYKIQSGDLLDIQVSTPIPGQTEIFSKEYNQTPGNQANPASLYLRGYVVDDSGSVQLPLIGLIKVVGYTSMQISDTIQKKLSEYLEYVSVTTKLLSFRITLLGEVKGPGTQVIYASYITIFQAIGLAGDLTDLANRKKVKLIRKTANDSQVINIDLSNKDIIASNYYYLSPNDVIYVEPLKAKVLRVNSASIQLTLSAITLFFVVINFINRTN